MADSIILLESAIKNDDTSNLEQKLTDYCSSHHDHVMTWTNNPLLQAWKHGSINCASKIVRLKPELACARDPISYTTVMHTICDSADVVLVKRVVEISPRLCLLTDLPHWRTPLHVAAIKGNEQVLREIVTVCPQSIAIHTRQNETALHLALKYDHVACFQILIAQLLVLDHMINLKELLNHKDSQGNTVLHIATSRGQIQILKMLLSDNPIIASLVEVNATNWRGFTALDLHYHNHSNMNRIIDMEITSLLLQARLGPNSSKIMKEEEPCQNNIIAANKMMHKVMLKTVLLTVFILVAGASYTSLFNLNTIYPKDDYNCTVGIGKAKNIISLKDMVMGRVHVPDPFLFMVLNTIIFTGSVVVIVLVTWSLVSIWSFCFRALPVIILGSMCASYALLVFKIIPKFSLTIGSLQISSFWAVWLFNLPLIFFTLTAWLAFKKFSN